MHNVGNPLKFSLLMITICLLTGPMSINVFATNLLINTTALPDGTKTYSYNATMQASGGSEPYTWSAVGLPLGLSIDPSSGVISGIPAPRVGQYPVHYPKFVVTDGSGISASKGLSLTVYENQVRIIYDTSTRPMLPTGYVDAHYSAGLEADYGVEPYTWSAQNLPAGLNIGSSTGIISGVPIVSTNTCNVTITVKESGSPDYSFSIIFGLSIENIVEPKSMISYTPITVTQAGTVYDENIQYQSAAEVIAALPGTVPVTLEDNSVTGIPIIWTDTDSYNAAIAGNYTFTSAWGDLPEGVDNDNAIAAPSVLVAVAPGQARPPIASFIMTPPESVSAGDLILVDASSSSQPDLKRDITLYEWDWSAQVDSDNQIIFAAQTTGLAQSHLYPYLGTNRVALRVTDDIGQQAIIYKQITVEACMSPVAVPGGPYEINWGGDLDLDGNKSYDPDRSYGDAIVSYWWDINNDGKYDVSDVAPKVSWATLKSLFNETLLPTGPAGYPRYPIRLKVADTTSREHVGVTTLAIWENAAPPAASIASTEPVCLSEAELNDGSLTSGKIVVTIVNGSLASDIAKADVTAANLPGGLDYTVIRTDATHLQINLTGSATHHAGGDDMDNLTLTIAQVKVAGAEGDLTTANISINFNDPSETGEEDLGKGNPGAVAIATKLLKAAGIKHNYKINGVKGNYISDVARMMGRGDAFNGVEKSDYDAYIAAVEDYLESRGLVLLPKS